MHTATRESFDALGIRPAPRRRRVRIWRSVGRLRQRPGRGRGWRYNGRRRFRRHRLTPRRTQRSTPGRCRPSPSVRWGPRPIYRLLHRGSSSRRRPYAPTALVQYLQGLLSPLTPVSGTRGRLAAHRHVDGLRDGFADELGTAGRTRRGPPARRTLQLGRHALEDLNIALRFPEIYFEGVRTVAPRTSGGSQTDRPSDMVVCGNRRRRAARTPIAWATARDRPYPRDTHGRPRCSPTRVCWHRHRRHPPSCPVQTFPSSRPRSKLRSSRPRACTPPLLGRARPRRRTRQRTSTSRTPRGSQPSRKAPPRPRVDHALHRTLRIVRPATNVDAANGSLVPTSGTSSEALWTDRMNAIVPKFGMTPKATAIGTCNDAKSFDTPCLTTADASFGTTQYSILFAREYSLSSATITTGGMQDDLQVQVWDRHFDADPSTAPPRSPRSSSARPTSSPRRKAWASRGPRTTSCSRS